MDTSVTNKTHTSDVIGTRNPWPLPANRQQLDSGQSSFRITPGGPPEIDAQENKAPNAPQGFKAPVSLPQGPGIGHGIGRFAGSHSALFPPGPQKSYHNRNPSTSIQNTNSRSLFAGSILDPKSPGSGPITTSSNLFEQWQAAEGGTSNGAEKTMKGKKTQNNSDSGSDGGITLAMVQAAFLQEPGIIGFPLRPVASKPSAVPQQQAELGSKELEQKQQELAKQEAKITKKPSRKPQPSLSSHMAAVLQTPGAVSFASTRRSSSATTVSQSYSAQVSITTPVEPGGDEDEAFDDKLELGPAPAEVPYIPPKPLPSPKGLTIDKLAEKYTDLDTTRYWGTPNTSSVYLRNTPQRFIVPTPITEQTGQNLLEETPRKFLQLRDGDIVGNEAPELPKENKGRRMMEKMGYKDGTPLGVGGSGGLEPVKVEMRVGNRGLGLSKEDLGKKERVEEMGRIGKANRIERELLERVAQSEKVAQMQRESLQIAIQNQLYQAQIDQMTQTRNNPARTLNIGGLTGASQEIIQQWQLEQMGLLGPTQFLRYTISTPWEIYKTRERISQILSHLDSSRVLGIVDYNSILWLCMGRAMADLQQSRIGFLVDAELMKIARREFMQVVIGKEQTGSGWKYNGIN